MRWLVAAVFIIAVSGPTQARWCDNHVKMIEKLNGKYGEYKRMVGRVNKGILEVYVSDNSTSFTIIMRTPTGKSACMMMSGQELFMLDKKPRHKPGKKM